MKCDVIAQGIIDAAKSVKLSVPLVVRLEGTNVERGKQLLKQSGLALIAADDLAMQRKRSSQRQKANESVVCNRIPCARCSSFSRGTAAQKRKAPRESYPTPMLSTTR